MVSTAKFSAFRYALQSLWHYRRVNLAVLLGVLVATAVLTGALIVGDSVRGSLRRLTIERLGRIDQILLADHFFREDLAAQTRERQPDLAGFSEALPAILLPETSLEHATDSGAVYRANQVTVVGCDEPFWDLSDLAIRPQALPQGRQIVLNEPLAQRLRAKLGDLVVLRLGKLGGVAQDSTLARKSDLTQNLAALEVVAIVPAEGLGRFSLRPNQALPRNAFLPRETLQQALNQPQQVNAILFASSDADQAAPPSNVQQLHQAISPTLEDAGLQLKHVRATYTPPATQAEQLAFEYFDLTSDRMLIPADVEQLIRRELSGLHVQAALTYLANSIRRAEPNGDGSTAIPYSTVSAVESSDRLGPMILAQRPMEPLADHEIVLNRWAAESLQAQLGDRIELTFFEPETTHGEPREQSVTLTLKTILPLTRPTTPYRRNRPARFSERPTWANDPDLTPQVAGVTDQESIDAWDPPFPFDYARIRKPDDEDYWDEYRTTPKAILAKATGQRLWGSRFGDTTSLRIAIDESATEADLRRRVEAAVQADLDAFGFSLQSVKQDGLQAAVGTTPFHLLFLGFSFFIIAAALMLVALLFRLNSEQRAQNAGLLLAVGLSRRQVLRLFLAEGLLISALGAALGTVAGIGYAALMLAGLRSWWLQAVVTPFLHLEWRPTSLWIGAVTGVITSLLTIWWTLRSLRRVPESRLLSGRTESDREWVAPPSARGALISMILLGTAVLLGVGAVFLRGEAQAGCFFGSGACVLAGLLVALARLFRSHAHSNSTGRINTLQLALRNVARNPGRSTLTIGLMASACFLIIAISAFRLAPTQAGAGGFALLAESELPIFDDWNDPAVREDLLGPKAERLQQSKMIALRMHDGDDASCRNLYQVRQPRLLGAPSALAAHFDPSDVSGFSWASAAPLDSAASNPWHLLESDGSGAIPVILDKNTAIYSLHLYGGIGEEFELDYGSAGRLRFQVVGLLSNSILQGSLIVSEANLLRSFPQTSGHRFFLIDCPPDQSESVGRTLEDLYSDQGLQTRETREVLQDLLAVQNTYLSTFQSLGGLGLLLGTLGIVAVQLRNVFERRGELALLQAVGFARQRIASLVMVEHLLLLFGGLGVGLLAALVAVLPHAWTGGARPPMGTLSAVLSLILAVGLCTGAIAVRRIVRTPVLEALRSD